MLSTKAIGLLVKFPGAVSVQRGVLLSPTVGGSCMLLPDDLTILPRERPNTLNNNQE